MTLTDTLEHAAAATTKPITLDSVTGDNAVTDDFGRAYLISQLIDAARDAAAHLATTDENSATAARELRDDLNRLVAEFADLLREPFRTLTLERGLTIDDHDLASIVYGAMRIAKWVDGILQVKAYLAMQDGQNQMIAAAAATNNTSSDTHASYL